MARILIIEDEPSIAMVLQEVLCDEGHAPTVIADGMEALEWLMLQPVPPDLVLVDLLVPGASGKEIVETMRGSLKLADVPVVLVTGATPSESVFPSAGSYQQIIGKPFDVLDILHMVTGLLSSHTQCNRAIT